MLRVPGATEHPDPVGYRGGSGRLPLPAGCFGAGRFDIPTAKLGVSGFPHGPAVRGCQARRGGIEGCRDTSEARLSFGISTWGNWQEVTSRGTYYLFVDTDKDGTKDYRLQTVREKGLTTCW